MAREAKLTEQLMALDEEWVKKSVTDLSDAYGISQAEIIRRCVRKGLAPVRRALEREAAQIQQLSTPSAT